GHYDFAEKAFARAQALSPDNAQIGANLAQIYLLTGRPAAAAELLEAVALKAPDSADVQRQLGMAYQELDDLKRADVAFRQAMELGAGDHGLLNNRAVILQSLGRPMEAIEHLELICRKGDDRFETLNNLGNLYRTVGRTQKAAELLAKALTRAPLNFHIHRNLALLKRESGDFLAGMAAARRAAICEPGSMDGLLILSEMFEHRADLAKAKRLLLRTLVGAPDNADAVALLARVHRRGGNAETALQCLEFGLSNVGDRPGRYKLLFESAQAEQSLGRHDKAFEALITANQNQISMMPPGRVDPERAFERVKALKDVMERACWPDINAAASVEPGRTPIFLVGFPRSGTTLLDQVLDSHPSVVVLEERPLVAAMISRLKSAGYAYPDDLPVLDIAMLDELRAGYFLERDTLVDVPEDHVFVDKMPLNIVHAALILRVFPEAKFLLALRDPCDVCLSCFMQSFELNDWMAVFTDIDATARLYDAVFDLWFQTAEKLNADHHVVRYEDLISDLRGTASAAIGFMGLEWDDRMAAFHEHAKDRAHLSTPSHSQVTQPVYTHAVQRWKKYGAAMDNVTRILKSRRSSLGYGD
ncbi:MAG: sulfotransferase, partial [Alphaproteobacteria bacterium]|nr:sulfotransferase [Alphaproteobacteria bacterium]